MDAAGKPQPGRDGSGARLPDQAGTGVTVAAVIACLNRKGGSGKTTVCLNLAAAIAEGGKRVIVLDLDPQQSATRWSAQARAAEAPAVPGFNIAADVFPVDLSGPKPAKVFQSALAHRVAAISPDMVLIDSPPELADPALIAALVADLVLITTNASPLDLWATEAAIRTAGEARAQRGDGKPLVSLVPSRLISGTLLAKDISASLGRMGEEVAPGIHQRVAVVEATMAGQTIVTYAKGSAGHAEFTALAKHALGRLESWRKNQG